MQHIVTQQSRWHHLIDTWHDRDISAGTEWEPEIQKHLNEAQIILLLVSPDFMASEYCYGIEMKKAMERHERKEAHVIPVILRPVLWHGSSFGKLQALPIDGKPITDPEWHNLDKAFFSVAEGIYQIIQHLAVKPSVNLPSSEKGTPLGIARPINSASIAQKNQILNSDSKSISTTEETLKPYVSRLSNIRPVQLEGERPVVSTVPRVKTPALVVLLGSTAALAGLEMMEHMRLLKPVDLRRIALVYIDIDNTPNAIIEFHKENAGKFQEFPLRIAVPAGISHVPRVLQGNDKEEQHTFIGDKIPQYYANGAGGIRNNGHVAACFNYPSIYNTLDAAVARITRLGAEQDTGNSYEVQANLVAFLGGGTGSGMLADLAIMIRDLLAMQQLKQRINLFCILPKPVRGANEFDLKWWKSNSTACLLELLAFSQAASGDPRGYYEKFMRNKNHRLFNDPIANEIYLVDGSTMKEISDITGSVGLDLFQRITNASGVGLLEHAKWVDRRTLGEVDDRGLPTMFGTTNPCEVRFPVEETAKAFAQISAAQLLPMIASYKPMSINFTKEEKSEWFRKWKNIARFDTNTGDPNSIKLFEFKRSDFENIEYSQLDILWSRVIRSEHDIERQIKEALALKRQDEMIRINKMPQQEVNGISFLQQRIQYLKRLEQEYNDALHYHKEQNISSVPRRPIKLEDRLINPNFFVRFIGLNLPSSVCKAYNETLFFYAMATRHRLLEQLLKDLIEHVQEVMHLSLSWFKSVEVDRHVRELKEAGRASMAWQGKLDYPRPNQYHIFDCSSLRTEGGENIALERLYRWATFGNNTPEEDNAFEYDRFLEGSIDYIMSLTPFGKAQSIMNYLEEQSTGRVADRIVNFFWDYYMSRFEDTNLFELFEKSAPISRKEGTRAKQISNYFLEHLQRIRDQISSPAIFEAELWHEGLSSLDTSLYLGVHWRDGYQKKILDEILDNLGSMTNNGQMAIVDYAIDPHRLELAFGQHAISISTVIDFYRDENSFMKDYLNYQAEWEKTGGKGNRPVHISGEAERLVWSPDALGFRNAEGQGVVLPERIIRRAIIQSKLSQGDEGTDVPLK